MNDTLTLRQSDYYEWLRKQEYVPKKFYKEITITAYIKQLDSRIAEEFKMVNVSSIFDIFDVSELKKLEKKYMSGQLNKRQQDFRSAYHSYIKFCETNEKTFSDNPLVDDVPEFINKTEGGKKVLISVRAERSSYLRKAAIKFHGLKCQVCNFNFKDKYGELGKDFIEVHHLTPLGENGYIGAWTNPKKDLSVVCSNCHRMLHRKKGVTLTIDELKARLT